MLMTVRHEGRRDEYRNVPDAMLRER
jgi:hypothetical protein